MHKLDRLSLFKSWMQSEYPKIVSEKFGDDVFAFFVSPALEDFLVAIEDPVFLLEDSILMEGE